MIGNTAHRLLISLLFLPFYAQAAIVTGNVRESSSNDAIAYATVSLLYVDSTLCTGSITNDNGFFTIESDAGDYILQVSYVGYKTAHRAVTLTQKKMDIGNIYLTEETIVMADVEIKADRPIIQRQMGKIVMNVSNTPFSVGFSEEELLRKAPGVMIDKDGKVTVNGKAVSVYIDGRPSYMSGEQLTAMLQGTDASMVDKIEIITQPSSKYDAAGGSGAIINIKLKKDKNTGTNGTLSAKYGGMYFSDIHQYLQRENVSLSLNHRSKKTYTAFSINQSYNQWGHTSLTQSKQPFLYDTLRTRTDTRSVSSNQWYNADLSTDWYIDDKNTVGFILRAPIGLAQYVSPALYNLSTSTLGTDTIQHLATEAQGKDIYPQLTANVNYTHIFSDSLSRELNIEFSYNRTNNASQTNYSNTVFFNDDALIKRTPDRMDLRTDQQVNHVEGKADLTTAFWKTGMIECGAKWQLNYIANGMTTDSVMPLYCSTTNTAYTYAEHIAALYFSIGKQFGEHWSAKIGLRGELTAISGVFSRENDQKTITQKPYFNLFPTANVEYTPTDKWSLSLSYNRSIWRPGYWYMNPFVEYRDAHSYSVGNPEIKPEFSNNVEFNVSWSRYVTVGFNFSHTNGLIDERPEIQDNGDVKYFPINMGTEYEFGPTVSLTEIPIVPKFKKDEQNKRQLDGAWLALTANVGLFDKISMMDPAIDPNFGTQTSLYAYYYGALTSYLPKDWQIGTDIWGVTPVSWGYSRMQGGYMLSGSVKKKWSEYGLTLSVNIQDALRSSVYKGYSIGMQDGYGTSFVFTAYSQCLTVGITWNFGQNQQHKYRRVGDTDEGGGKKSRMGM